MNGFIYVFDEETSHEQKLAAVNDYIIDENVEHIEINGNFSLEYYKLLVEAIKNINIVSLNIVNDPPNHELLNKLGENLLSSNITNLSLFNCANHETIISIVSKLINSSVTHLYLDLDMMRSKNFVSVIDSLRNAHVTHLNLSNNKFNNNKTIKSIVECLPTLPLIKLNLAYCDLCAHDIADALSNTKICDLNLSWNNMSTVEHNDAHALSQISMYTHIKYLRLHGCQIDCCYAGTFFCHLNSLNLGCNNIGNEEIDAIVKNINGNPITLTGLNMRNNRINATGLHNLFINIINKSAITKLDLSHNEIGNERVTIIAANLGIICDLNIECCKITQLETLIENMKSSCITKLNLANNAIGDEAGIIINNNLSATSITNLNLEFCKIGTNIVAEMVANLVNSSITHFNCQHNGTRDHPENKAYFQQLKLCIVDNYQILKFGSKSKTINSYLRRNAKLAKDRRFKTMKGVDEMVIF